MAFAIDPIKKDVMTASRFQARARKKLPATRAEVVDPTIVTNDMTSEEEFPSVFGEVAFGTKVVRWNGRTTRVCGILPASKEVCCVGRNPTAGMAR